jgi:hypothetical protein
VNDRVAKAHGFSLRAGVSCEAHQRELREQLCPYVPPDTIVGDAWPAQNPIATISC